MSSDKLRIKFDRVWSLMRRAAQRRHTSKYLLTKRAEQLAEAFAEEMERRESSLAM